MSNPINHKILKDSYIKSGYYSPINIFNENEIKKINKKLSLVESKVSNKINSELRYKSHLVFPFLAEIVRNQKILDVVETILGPNLLVWGSGFFIKEPLSKTYVSWHQDSNYWGLSNDDVLTAWVAFTESNIKSGCMKIIPSSHKYKIMNHSDLPDKNNLLSRGQTINNLKNTKKSKNLILQKGQMSIHHIGLAHSSDSNLSNDRRIGFAIRYIPPYIKQSIGKLDSASLVRGIDKYNHFITEPVPSTNYDHQANLFRIEMWENAKMYFMKN